jgi:hypothetical protein
LKRKGQSFRWIPRRHPGVGKLGPGVRELKTWGEVQLELEKLKQAPPGLNVLKGGSCDR